MGTDLTMDDLPALDKEQLDSLLDESDHVHDLEQPAEAAHEPVEHIPEQEDPEPYEEPEQQDPVSDDNDDQQKQAYLSWLSPTNSDDYIDDSNNQIYDEEHVEEAHEENYEEQPALPEEVLQPVSDKPSPFERLYNANPELFDGMTVGEFVPHAMELRKLEDSVEQMRTEADKIKIELSKLEAKHQSLLDQASEKQRKITSFLERYGTQNHENQN